MSDRRNFLTQSGLSAAALTDGACFFRRGIKKFYQYRGTGYETFFAGQDVSKDPFRSITKSIGYLKKHYF